MSGARLHVANIADSRSRYCEDSMRTGKSNTSSGTVSFISHVRNAARAQGRRNLTSGKQPPYSRRVRGCAGSLEGHKYFIVVDSYSKWPEIFQMRSETESNTIENFTDLWARLKNPGADFQNFCSRRSISHPYSPPFNPQSNRQAERFMDIFKQTFQKLRRERGQSNASIPC